MHRPPLLITALLLAAALLSACEKKAPDAPTETAVSNTSTATNTATATNAGTTEEKPGAPVEAAFLITSEGVGPYGFEKKLEAFSAKKDPDDEMVKLAEGLEAQRRGSQLACAFHVGSKKYKTAQGLGIGDTFGAFEKAYGTMTVEEATGELWVEKASIAISVDGPEPTAETMPKPEAKVISIRVGGCGI